MNRRAQPWTSLLVALVGCAAAATPPARTTDTGVIDDAGRPDRGVDLATASTSPTDAGIDLAIAPADAEIDVEIAPADAEAVDDAVPPSGGIDLSRWSLQLPTGTGTSPTTIAPAALGAFSDAYFYAAPAGGRFFMDPATGVTTSGSLHCRTELREMTATGGAAAWPSSGTNVLTVAGRVTELGGGTAGHVTVAQIFNGSDSIPLAELELSARGGFELLYEEAKGAGTTVDLHTPRAVGEAYTFSLSLSAGVLAVTIDDAPVFARTPGAALAAKTFYFKAGAYDQTALAGPASTAPYTIVEVDALTVAHR